MMHLKLGHAAARLATPSISLENSVLKLTIALQIELDPVGIHDLIKSG
jgi:hypothetical protein